jgi:hypothetical protein
MHSRGAVHPKPPLLCCWATEASHRVSATHEVTGAFVQRSRPSTIALFRIAEALDARLLAASPRTKRVAIAVTFVVIALVGIRNVPRPYVDFRSISLLSHVPQYETYGTDTIGDGYEARVVLNDVGDMYTKALVEQTPLEARTWSKEASAPYPPAMLLVEAGLYAVGERTGIGFYGMILALAVLFLLTSSYYCLQARWYVFPLLYLNFSYLGYRLFYVQDCSYLIMLTVVMAALFLARRGRRSAHALMALAVTMKLSPLYYVRNVTTMSRGMRVLFLAILAAGLLLPIFIWDNYLYIYGFHELKGGASETIAAVLISIPFAALLWYVETRLGFDIEDRIGWGLVPFGLFLGLKMNAARHLLLVLLIPDKRGVRNIAAGVSLWLPTLFPGLIAVNSALLICAALLIVGLVYYLDVIGWDLVRADACQPAKTWRMMLGPTRVS